MRASVKDISLQVFRVVQCQYESKFKGKYSENMKESLASGAQCGVTASMTSRLHCGQRAQLKEGSVVGCWVIQSILNY